jgi:hypothetical protein
MIKYTFKFESGITSTFEIDFDSLTSAPDGIPDWMLLENNKCPHCPLKSCDTKICPAALEVSPVIEAFKDTLSTEQVFARVETPERNYEKQLDAQRAITALVGLLMAKSQCPILSELRGLAKFHLPFANTEEALFRSVGAYFLKQYYKHKAGQADALDLKGLSDFYESLCLLNEHFYKRIRLASKKDANLNAVVVLHSLSSIVILSLDDQLENLKDQFGN